MNVLVSLMLVDGLLSLIFLGLFFWSSLSFFKNKKISHLKDKRHIQLSSRAYLFLYLTITSTLIDLLVLLPIHLLELNNSNPEDWMNILFFTMTSFITWLLVLARWATKERQATPETPYKKIIDIQKQSDDLIAIMSKQDLDKKEIVLLKTKIENNEKLIHSILKETIDNK